MLQGWSQLCCFRYGEVIRSEERQRRGERKRERGETREERDREGGSQREGESEREGWLYVMSVFLRRTANMVL